MKNLLEHFVKNNPLLDFKINDVFEKENGDCKIFYCKEDFQHLEMTVKKGCCKVEIDLKLNVNAKELKEITLFLNQLELEMEVYK